MCSYLTRSIFIFGLIVLSYVGYSQFLSQKEIFRINLDQVNLVYTPPAEFKEADSCSVYLFYYTKDHNRNKYLYNLDAKVLSRDSSICIGFNTVKLFLKDDSSAFLKAMFPGRTQNTAYKLGIRHKADTIHDSVVYYSPQKSKQLFNADISGTYGFGMEIPFDGKYYRCRIVFMHKENIGDAEIYYFYEDERNRNKVDRLIKKTYSMLKFKN